MDNDIIELESPISTSVEFESTIGPIIEDGSAYETEIADGSAIYQAIELPSLLTLECE